jgi:Zn/Cd-binding protein ZinT
MSKACSSEQEAIDTVAFYKMNKDTECFYREEGGKWLVYRKSDSKTIKSINYSPADLKKVMADNHR